MTKLAWVVTRWYAPAQGRFISEDSLLGEPRDPDSRHLYAYGAGDPVGSWDPDGRLSKPGAPAWRYLGDHYDYNSPWMDVAVTTMASVICIGLGVFLVPAGVACGLAAAAYPVGAFVLVKKEKFIYEKAWFSTNPGRGVKWTRWHGWKVRLYDKRSGQELAPADEIWPNVWQRTESRFGSSAFQQDLWLKCRRTSRLCMGSTSWHQVTFAEESGRLRWDIKSSRWPAY